MAPDHLLQRTPLRMRWSSPRSKRPSHVEARERLADRTVEVVGTCGTCAAGVHPFRFRRCAQRLHSRRGVRIGLREELLQVLPGRIDGLAVPPEEASARLHDPQPLRLGHFGRAHIESPAQPPALRDAAAHRLVRYFGPRLLRDDLVPILRRGGCGSHHASIAAATAHRRSTAQGLSHESTMKRDRPLCPASAAVWGLGFSSPLGVGLYA